MKNLGNRGKLLIVFALIAVIAIAAIIIFAAMFTVLPGSCMGN